MTTSGRRTASVWPPATSVTPLRVGVRASPQTAGETRQRLVDERPPRLRLGVHAMPLGRIASRVHERPRQGGGGRFVAREQHPQYVRVELLRAERLAPRASRDQRLEEVASRTLAALRTPDDIVGIGLDRAAMLPHRARRRAERDRHRRRELAQPVTDPRDDLPLMVRDVGGPVMREMVAEEHPGRHDERDATHGELEIDLLPDRQRRDLAFDQPVEVGDARVHTRFRNAGASCGARRAPRLVPLGEEVLAHTEPDRHSHRGRACPRVALGHEHRAGRLGIGQHPHRRRAEAQPGQGTERGRLVEPAEALGVEGGQRPAQRPVDPDRRWCPHWIPQLKASTFFLAHDRLQLHSGPHRRRGDPPLCRPGRQSDDGGPDRRGRRAGKGSGGVHRYFATKNDLVRAVFDAQLEHGREQLADATDLPRPAPGHEREYLELIGRLALTRAEENRDVALIMLRDAHNLPAGLLDEQHTKNFELTYESAARGLRELQAAHGSDATIDADASVICSWRR